MRLNRFILTFSGDEKVDVPDVDEADKEADED